jgi:hypothetical protein
MRSRFVRIARMVCLFSVACVAACGGSDGGSSSTSSPPPALTVSYTTPPALVLNEPMAPLKPTVTGSATTYSVNPALPAGITISAGSGIISGTPQIVSPKTAYTVTAADGTSSATTTVTIVVNSEGTMPAIQYGSPGYSFTVGVSAQSISPTTTGGTVSSWSIQPALPSGLTFSSADGSISGTPGAAAAPANYVVSALGTGGTATADLTVAVSAGPWIDLGHAAPVMLARLSGSRLLTQDQPGHWVLWNTSTGTSIVTGDSSVFNSEFGYQATQVDLEGSTVVLQTATGLEVRGAATGQVLAEISAAPTWWKLAVDGSYICAGSQAGLTVWSTLGSVLLTKSGDYSGSIAFAAPGQIQIAGGPAGANVIATISVPGGAATVSPTFQGQFQSWFTDGSSFLTALAGNSGGTVWVYSSAAAQQDIAQLPTLAQLGGTNGWYWTVTPNGLGTTSLYRVGSAGQSYVSYQPGISAVAVSSGNTLALFGGGPPPPFGQVTIIDLSGSTAPSATYATPVQQYLSVYAASSPTNWFVGNVGGVVLQGGVSPTLYFDYGEAVSIAGSATNAAIATASGRVLYFNATNGALQGTIPEFAGQVALSADGTVLAAAAGGNEYDVLTDRSIYVYSLPTGSSVATFPFTQGSAPYLASMTLSASGATLGELFQSVSPCIAQTVSIASMQGTWCDSVANSAIADIALSPDGTLVAASTALPNNITVNSPPVTNIYLNGTLSTAVSGWAVGWLDNQRVLVQTFAAQGSEGLISGTGTEIVNSSGTVLAIIPTPSSKTPIGGIRSLQPIAPSTGTSPTSIYSSTYNTIYSLSSGAVTWSSGSPYNSLSGGAVAGSSVVFESGNLILAEPYGG